MPVTNQDPIVEYIANGTTVAFNYTFRIMDASHLKVYEDGVEITTGFTISGVGDAGGGTVTYSAAPAQGVTVRLERVTSIVRNNDYITAGSFTADSLDDDFDTDVMMIQDLSRKTLQEVSDSTWDAKSKRLKNLATPVNDSDAATKAYADTTLASTQAEVTYAAEWANKAEDSLISSAAGGDTVDDYSSLHWANKSSASATAASTAQSAAEAAQAAAEAAQAAAENAYDNFDDRYLGSKSSDPTLDNDGNALIEGALYWNTTNKKLRIYDGVNWGDISFSQTQGDARYVQYELSNSLTKLLHPDASKGFGDLYKQGVYPAFFNQQWGGAPYGGLPDGSIGEVATGYIKATSGFQNFADLSSREQLGQGFKVGQTTDVASVWVKVYKVGNPTDSLQLAIYDDNGGSPNAVITNGTATAQSGRLHTTSDQGEWIKFTFPTAPNVVAGTQYHIVLNRSGAVDGVNYWRWAIQNPNSYPHGGYAQFDGTAWTAYSSNGLAFLVESATTVLQSDTLLGDGKLQCYEGATLNQSGGFVTSNGNFLNHEEGSFIVTGSGFTAGKTILDTGVGTDNNRIVLRCNATTGYVSVTLYESDENSLTVTGTTDVSTGSHVIGFVYRAKGDGNDFLKLFVDGQEDGTSLTSQTITLDPGFAVDGATTIGGGFPLAPTWTDSEDMSVLPSASGWTWTGSAVESNVMSVDGGVLYQNGAGYGSTDNGYYQKTTNFNNATGWVVETKVKIKNSPNDPTGNYARITVEDGTKQFFITIHEYFLGTVDGIRYQHDFTRRTVVKIVGKGSNYYIFIDGLLVVDGTSKLTVATTNNFINFGDRDSGTSGNNADVEWHYVKYYESAYLPEFTSGAISELAYWNGDRSSAMPYIFDGGTPQSVKRLAGVKKNYIEKVKFKKEVKGINPSISTTSNNLVPIPEMEIYFLGQQYNIDAHAALSGDTAGSYARFAIGLDGLVDPFVNGGASSIVNVNQIFAGIEFKNGKTFNGLHYVQSMYSISAGTGRVDNRSRELSIEGE